MRDERLERVVPPKLLDVPGAFQVHHHAHVAGAMRAQDDRDPARAGRRQHSFFDGAQSTREFRPLAADNLPRTALACWSARRFKVRIAARPRAVSRRSDARRSCLAVARATRPVRSNLRRMRLRYPGSSPSASATSFACGLGRVASS